MNVDDYGPLLTAEAFLEIDFGERIKAELEEGAVKVVERGPCARVGIAANLLGLIHPHFRGSGNRTYGSLLALKTGNRSVRFPDVSVYGKDRVVTHCDDRDLMSDPLLVVHVCRTDRVHGRLADEYRRIEALQALLLVDFERHLVRSLVRTPSGDWWETLIGPDQSVEVPSLDLTLPHADIFSAD